MTSSREKHGIDTVADLVEAAGALKPMAAVMAGGERVEDLRLVESARDRGIIDRIMLVGRKKHILESVEKVGISVPQEDIVEAKSDNEAAAATVDYVKAGVVQMVLKGSTPTHVLNRHMLPLAIRPTVSLVSIFDAAPIAGGRPMILTDAGITTSCTYGRIIGIIHNAVAVARNVLHRETPRVALLSATEKNLPSLSSTQLGTDMTQRQWEDAIVYGPLSLDLATDPGAVASKGLPDLPAAREVAGQADILVCPNIETGNVIYKLISALIKYGEASLANIIMGFPMPYVLLSRSDALETRLNSLALGAIYAQCQLGKRPVTTVAHPAAKKRLYRVAAINPGSTSTKIALFENDQCIQYSEADYTAPNVKTAGERRRQAEELAQLVQNSIENARWKTLDGIAARGGFMPRPPEKLSGGSYSVAELKEDQVRVNDLLVNAMLENPEKHHPSNLGIPVAAILSQKFLAPSFVVDPVVVDEFSPEAELSGYKGIVRRSTSHALSVRAAARRAAQIIGRKPEDINLVIAHLGGGVTVAAVRGGKMTDNNIALLGGGPFTPQRAGHLPLSDLMDLCYSGRYTRTELSEELTKRGGLQSYLGEYRLDVIESRIESGDQYAALVCDAMIYQVAKEIGAMYVAAGCDAEAIVLTGGMVRAKRLPNQLRSRVSRLAPVIVLDEPLEMEALAEGAIRALTGESPPQQYAWNRDEWTESGGPKNA